MRQLNKMFEISLQDYWDFFFHLLIGKRIAHEKAMASMRGEDIRPYYPNTENMRVLDLGNGRMRPQSYILAKQGLDIHGVDLVNGQLKGGEALAYRLVNFYYRAQLQLSSIQARRYLKLTGGDVGHLPYCSESFDLVTSVAAFEHFLDVEQVLAEVHRILKPKGLIWLIVHSFTSLSGGHNVRLMQFPLRDLPRGVDPWDHLRKRRIPFRVPLNEWRLSQYREVLGIHFEILKEYCALYEGEEFLTDEIAAELTQYDREELFCATRVFLARKK